MIWLVFPVEQKQKAVEELDKWYHWEHTQNQRGVVAQDVVRSSRTLSPLCLCLSQTRVCIPCLWLHFFACLVWHDSTPSVSWVVCWQSRGIKRQRDDQDCWGFLACTQFREEREDAHRFEDEILGRKQVARAAENQRARALV